MNKKMRIKTNIIDVTEENLSEYPQVICYINPKHEHFHLKIDWLKQRFKEGLKKKILYPEGEKNLLALSNIFRVSTAGARLMPRAICSFTASGLTEKKPA